MLQIKYLGSLIHSYQRNYNVCNTQKTQSMWTCESQRLLYIAAMSIYEHQSIHVKVTTLSTLLSHAANVWKTNCLHMVLNLTLSNVCFICWINCLKAGANTVNEHHLRGKYTYFLYCRTICLTAVVFMQKLDQQIPVIFIVYIWYEYRYLNENDIGITCKVQNALLVRLGNNVRQGTAHAIIALISGIWQWGAGSSHMIVWG